ncbi:type II secretion system minor pseudopilin GspJ [Vibrio ziniensis]|uniref:Type II secretion system protein J n=1 Tax=Vibrio ziniensis TaxID=2711221 RepID=A0A6G7CEP0_9VIBR|nr:type II secretion system minor pseudopilin GspJ [Vibrio ziniensis]QIH40585.1 type II secretion system minor pseudopilin GspJ [Vibrio ziniensis]
MSLNRKAAQGFTLIEVLVAIAIFASLSVAAYQVLHQVQRSNEVSLERTARLTEINRAFVLLDADFRQIAARQFRTQGGEPSKQFLIWQDGLLDSEQYGVVFTRLGWHNPQQQFPRGEITKVAYRIRDGVLERVWWQYPDTSIDQDGLVTPLLTQVDSWSMRFYFEGKWSESWDKNLQLPNAVAVKLTLKDYGDIERIYLVAGGMVQGGGDDSDS